MEANGNGTRVTTQQRRARLRLTLFLAAGIAAAGVMLGLYALDALKSLELRSVDTRFSVRGTQPQPKDLAVVAIDTKTFNDLKIQWPFPRGRHAKVLDRLRKDGAKAIAFDVQFTEPTTRKQDSALIDAVGRSKNVVLATTEVDDKGRTAIFGGDQTLRAIGAKAGNALLPNDAGGTIRRTWYDARKLKTLGVVTAEDVLGKPIPRSALGGKTAWIDYQGGPGTMQTTSYSDVYDNNFRTGTFKNRIVVIGPAAPTLGDVHPTSVTGEDLMSGAEIQANAIWTALHGFPLQPIPTWWTPVLIVLMAFAAPALFLLFKPREAVLILILIALVYTVGSQMLFNHGTIVPVVYPLIALGLAAVLSTAVHAVTAAFEREMVRDVFSRFVPESVVSEVLSQTGEGLRLGGERRIATVLFSDLRGFTSYAETLPPATVISVLNRYLTLMSDVILDNGGTLVAYMGDGIMAVFGAPIEMDDHADRALRAARHMTGPALQEFNQWMRDQGVGEGFRMGVGLMSGEVMSGNVGSERRLEYTAIGDTTNTAARLEGMTKGQPYMVFVSGTTVKMANDPPADLVSVDRMEVRGRRERVDVWALPDPPENGSDHSGGAVNE
jgi:adenylate cyclase